MNDRQKALFEYMKTIAPHVRHARSPEELLKATLKCVQEDIGFVAHAFALGMASMGQKVIENQMNRMQEQFAQKAGAFLSDLFSPAKPPSKK